MAFTLEVNADTTVEITEPLREGFSDDLSGAIQFMLANTIYKVLENLGDGLGTIAASFLVRFLKIIEPELVDYVSPLLKLITDQKDVPEEVVAFIEKLINPEHEAGAAILAGLGQSAGGAVVGSVVQSLLAPVTYGINEKIRPARPDVGALVAMNWRQAIDTATYTDWLHDLGFPDAAIKGFETLMQPRLAVPDLIAWAWRSKGNPTAIREELLKRGYSTEEADKIIVLADYIPPPADLVRMAVREAWSPAAIATFGLAEDLPADFVKWAEKQGMNKDWAARYWSAHWQLPSPTQVFDMLHRGIIGPSEVALYLKTADYSSYWRDRLIKLSYANVTRVDLRRLYKLGIFDYNRLVQGYKNLGYADADADALAKWTDQEYGDEAREVTKADILGALTDGVISSGEARTMLDHLGYNSDQIGILIARVEYKLAQEGQAARVEAVHAAFSKGKIDANGARSQLGALNLSAAYMAALIEKWSLEDEAKISLPTVGDLGQMYVNDLIGDGVYTQIMAKRGYMPEHIALYKALLLDRKAEEAKAEQDRTKAEQDRIARLKIRDKLTVERARLDVELANSALTIVEAKRAITLSEDIAQVDQLSNLIADERVRTAQLKVEKATLPLLYPPPGTYGQ